jgi:hypothetical protein
MLHLSQNICFKPCWKQQVNYNSFAKIIGGEISKTPQTIVPAAWNIISKRWKL